MLNVDEVFFDTLVSLMPEETVVKENLVSSSSNYDIWLREPGSIKERRETFFSKMGFLESSTLTINERIPECSGSPDVSSNDDDLLSERRQSNSEANCSVDYSEDDICIILTDRESNENLAEKQLETKQVRKCVGDTKKVTRWWKQFTESIRKKQASEEERKLFRGEGMFRQMRVEPNRKRFKEFTAIYASQEIKAHSGRIRTMKFSPDGQYLASGGEDGLVCIWHVSLADASCKSEKLCYGSWDKGDKFNLQKKKTGHTSIIIPEKIFHIEEEPLHKIQGHSSDVLALAWSSSNHLLSSSMDKTVCLWQVCSSKCLGVFRHSNYVTCIQFSPADENYFVSGSIDGKVRIWRISKRRVEDWANVRDIVSAVCYQPNGKGFVVGTFSGTCRFYELSGGELQLNAEISICSRQKSSGNKITGMQFLKNDSQRLMITSEDSKIRILDGLEVVRKYKGLPRSGSQMSASVTSDGRHIVSVGEDSCIYIWNYDDLSIQASKQVKSITSCEHFFFEGVSVVLPWSEWDGGQKVPTLGNPGSSFTTHNSLEASSRVRNSQCFSLANWFSVDGMSRATTTWPEEKLPIWDIPSAKLECRPWTDNDGHLHQHLHCTSSKMISSTWGLVFVTANMDGKIKIFHNYGLPVKT